MEVGALLMDSTYKMYDAKASQNRTHCTRETGHNVRMETPKDRLRQARQAAGFATPTEAARAHPREINVNTLISNENGNRDISRKAAEKYAKLFGAEAGWILYGEGGVDAVAPKQPHEPANAIVTGGMIQKGTKIPLYGAAVGGDYGEFELNGNRLDDIFAPPSLSGIPEAYGVQVVGESMWPRYEDGETVYVNPRRRPVKGDYVVAQIHREEHGPRLAFIKKLVRHTQNELILEQFNPAKQIRFDGKEVDTVHYVLRSGE
ncbi:LexA family transcriptional regulator [Sinorhizobium medicae]|uniref:LexA family transcriptional regulator n=1 Tax=Sinorhizobium medicae TaxID=110321 RepID=UPI001FB56597|nr:S24 family peptidase [Sinorhizobium medicae]